MSWTNDTEVEQRRLGMGRPPWTSRDSPPAAVQQWDGLIAVNYAARAAGVKRGMRAADAQKACPNIVLVHVETISEGTEEISEGSHMSLAPDRRTQKACLRRYRQASEEVFAVVQKHAGRCEMASIDEVYLDLSEEVAQRLSGSLDLDQLAAAAVCPNGCMADTRDAHLLAALDVVQRLRDDIFAETGFTVSAGIAESKQVAKLASACHKPNKQTLIPSAGVLPFMASVKLKDLRGLGGKLGQKLREALQLDPESPTAELQKVPFAELQRIVGDQSASMVHRLCRGEDREEVKPGEMKRKQYLSFKSLSPAAESVSDLEPWLASLAAELVGRLREDPRRPRSLVLYHRGRLDADHGRNWMAGRTSELTKTISRSVAFPDLHLSTGSTGEMGANAASIIADTAKKLLLERVSSPFPCSRLALGASDFRKVEGSIASFFAKAKVDGAEEVSGVEDDVLPTQAETQSDASDGGSERAPEATSVEATSVGPKDRQPANVAEFHKASRLHFLGTWRERFERWRAEGGAGPRSSHDVTESLRRDLATLQKEPLALWAHLDMDCFFASVATRDMDAPGEEVPTAVVSGLGPSSEICSANYAARRAGVNTHLWFVERATSILPSLRLVPISSELLRSVEDTWKQVYQLLVTACHDVPDNVLMRSCDESALRVEGFADPVAWAEALRKAVFQQTGCTCSVGLGPTQLVAKLATKACKPNGVRRVLEDEVKKFVGELPLKDMPQVGRAMTAKLQERGLETCSDLQALEKKRLREWFGVKGETLWLNAQGLDQETSLVPTQRKSVSAEMNWGIRCQDRPAAVKILSEVAKQLCDRLSICNLRANHLTLKLKIAVPGWVEPIKKGGHGQCDDVSRSSSLPLTSDLQMLQRFALQLFDSLSPDPVRLRGMGLAARLGSGETPSASSRSPKKAHSEASGIARWLRRPESKQAIDVDDVDLDSTRPTVTCPVCMQVLDPASADAHVNRHFEEPAEVPGGAEPPAKRPRLKAEGAPGSDSECEIIA
ncbi:unnamed protein product [Durusdinium trenchii]|uniref:DNA polymerase eta n=1 Tax=Durusdinium trenchii TaxID=1381693 RepID=A0ABP0IQ95_9DINO